MNLQEYQDLKEAAETKRREADQAAGAVRQLQAQMREQFKVDTLEGAEKLLERERKAKTELERKAEKLLHKFTEKWGEKICQK